MKKILASAITFCLMFSVMQMTVFAKDAFNIDKSTAAVNETVTVTFTQPATVVASSLGLDIRFDNSAFEIVDIAEAPYADLQPSLSGCNNAGNVAIAYVDPTFEPNTTVEEGTVLLSITFKVKKTATAGVKYFYATGYNVTGEFDDIKLEPVFVTPEAGNLTKTVTITSKSTGGSSGGSSGTTAPSYQESTKSGWSKEGNNWYYYINSAVKKGWLKDGDTWYYLDAQTGAMRMGWVKDGSWYFLKSSGAMATGWVKDQNTWYFLKSSGAMATGWVKDQNTWYYMNTSGAMKVGWLNDNGKWYYLNSSGAMVTNTVIDGYKIDSNGVWVK